MKLFRIARWTFGIVGLAMLAGALALYVNTRTFLQEATQAPGTVVELLPVRSDGSTTWKPVVRFTTGAGREVEVRSSSSSSPPAYERGETVTVYYRPEAPASARISGFFSLWGGAVILASLGGVFFLVGAAGFVVPALLGRKADRLRAQGRRIETDVTGVEVNTSLSVNDRHPWRIVTQWLDPASSQLHLFRSENLWLDPTGQVQGRRITVFIDPSNPRSYHMDVSFLPGLAK